MSWSFAASTPILLIGLTLWLAAGWLFLQHWRRAGGRRVALWLESTRLGIITLLVLTLLRPEFVQHIQRTAKPEIVVLSDASGSMATRDLSIGNRVITRADWLAQQRQAQPWKPLEKSAIVSIRDFAADPGRDGVHTATNAPGKDGDKMEVVAAGSETDLNRALDEVLKRQPNLKAVLLLTDGDWNSGPSPVVAATRFREQDVPIFAVAVGREKSLPDLAVENVSAPAYGLFGEQIVIPFKISSHLTNDVKTTVSLVEPSGEETRKEIIIPAQGELSESILWSPRAVGEATLTLQLPVEKDEAIPENNRREFRINIRIEKLKVLVVDSLPRWEYRYLRNALDRDPGVEMNSILYHPGITIGDGRNYLKSFPATKEALSTYDVIFLGDVGLGQNELAEHDAVLIKGLVEQQASGLVLLPGARGRELTLMDSALGDLLPVVFDKAKPEGIGLQNEANLLLSSTGKRHWLTRFDADEDRNEELWKQLPGFFWSAAIEKSRPGSEVLAVHSAQRNASGRMPLLVTRAAGSGKVLFMGTDSAWRWRRGVEDKYHYRFWSQIVRWMAHQRHLGSQEGVRVSYSPERPQPGDAVFLQASITDVAGSPLENSSVTGRITSPSGRVEQLAFTPVDGGWGVFTSGFRPEGAGTYRMEIAGANQSRKLAAEIVVVPSQREKIGQPVNRAVLDEIAAITQGASASYEALAEIVKKISLLPEPKPMEKRIRLWSNPWWGGSLLLLLVIYWIGRKLAGMV